MLLWVTTQQSELNELKLTVLWGQYHYKYSCYHWLGTSLSIYWLCLKFLSCHWSASLSTNNDSANNTTFPFLERHLWTLHTSYLLTYKSIVPFFPHFLLWLLILIFKRFCYCAVEISVNKTSSNLNFRAQMSSYSRNNLSLKSKQQTSPYPC